MKRTVSMIDEACNYAKSVTVETLASRRFVSMTGTSNNLSGYGAFKMTNYSPQMAAELGAALLDAAAICGYKTAFNTPAPAKKASPHGAQEYKGNGKHSWEMVVDNTYRLRVPGGWLYAEDTSASSTVFVPLAECIGYSI